MLCETLARILDVPFVTAEATSLAHNRYVNEEIEAILQRLVDKAGGDVAKAQRGIVFIDEIDKLKAPEGQPQSNSGESVQHALLKIMEGSQVRLANANYIDTANILFICGGAFVGLTEIVSQSHSYKFISMARDDTQKILDRLNSRVKPTDLVHFRADSGIHRAAADRRPLQGPHAQDAGADHDRAAELASTASSAISSGTKASSSSSSRRSSIRSRNLRSSTRTARAACAASSRK